MRICIRNLLLVRFTKFLKSERGSAESALVLVPTLILFLVGAQIAYVAHGRNVSKLSAQDQASARAISGEFVEGDEFLHIDSSGDGQNLDLLITHNRSTLRNLIPTLINGESSGREIDVSGIAIVENQR